jgi:hypothetical protein
MPQNAESFPDFVGIICRRMLEVFLILLELYAAECWKLADGVVTVIRMAELSTNLAVHWNTVSMLQH